MNRHTARALVQDAFYQVLDNKIFRILVLLAIVLIAPTFLVAFKPDEVSVLFGWWTFSYSDIGFLTAGRTASNANVLAIQALQSIFVQTLAGTFGIFFSLAATAFFVPRMLEKGEADTLFSKPAGRFVLLFARYVSGVLFVGVLALVLVLGMHIGLLLRSGYSDPGFLWSVLTLVYTFALIHAFSTMVGVITRSAVTALLVSLMFFMFNGCVHQLWVQKEFDVEATDARNAAIADEGGTVDGIQAETYSFPRIAVTILDGLHYPLPKTSDADVLTRKLRTVVAGVEFELEDKAGKLAIQEAPKGLARQAEGHAIDLASTPVAWTVSEGGHEVARISIARRSRTAEHKSGDRTRTARTSGNSAANEFVKTLEGRTDLDGKPQKARETTGIVRDFVRWKELRPSGPVARERAFLALEDWMFEIDLECSPAWRESDEHKRVFPDFLRGLQPQRDTAADFGTGRAAEWYDNRFGWSSPLRFNAFFSLGTSIAFALLMLGIARWRLSRIDF